MKTNPWPGVEPQHIVPADSNVIPEDPADVVNNMFCFVSPVDKQHGALCTDATGALPAISSDGCKNFFVVYVYDTKYVVLRNLSQT